MNLILTFDYELFGDGSGDVFKHIIEPTERIFSICRRRFIKTTLFFEVVEYWQLKKEWDNGNKMGYTKNPIEAIERQVQNAALEGHDIQLHIHPQWVDAIWKGDRWEMDMNNWRLGDFKGKNNYSIEDLLREGKRTLEELVQKVIPNYKCIALRAGAYNIMPSVEVYQAMKNVGLKLDSSVYPGGYETGDLSKFDYRNVSLNKDFWWADPKDITQSSTQQTEIMEIPIFSLPQRRIFKLLNLEKIKQLKLGEGKAMSSVAKDKVKNKSYIEKIRFLFEKEAFTWDFCLFDKLLHKRFFSYINENLKNKRSAFVIIGHPKSWRSDNSLLSLIHLARRNQHQVHFKTLKEIHEEFNS